MYTSFGVRPGVHSLYASGRIELVQPEVLQSAVDSRVEA